LGKGNKRVFVVRRMPFQIEEQLNKRITQDPSHPQKEEVGVEEKKSAFKGGKGWGLK